MVASAVGALALGPRGAASLGSRTWGRTVQLGEFTPSRTGSTLVVNLTVSALVLLSALAAPGRAQELAHKSAPPREPFPTSSALAEGLSPDAVTALDELVRSFVDNGEVVGAELFVLKNGRSVLHEVYGWRDREAKLAMAPGSVFCVRSMTKPLIGAAVAMLIDERKLKLGDRIAQHLPAFDGDGSREITVEQLLTHTSGLPMSLILGEDLRQLAGIRAVAELGAGHALEFAPGSAFHYSDQGTDTLTALIEVVSGQAAAEFVTQRLLDPLGMHDSACVLTEGHPLRARACADYGGARGEWTAFWRPDQPPLFQFFLGSQGLYSTVEDYARFLELWQGKGRIGKQRLLSVRTARDGLKPGPHPFQAPTGFPSLRCEYGRLMQLWTGPDPKGEDGEREVVAFGHTGSDGTHAWVFPEHQALALYFTQSRGTSTGLRVEEALARVFLGAPFDPNTAAPPFEEYLGYYWEGEGDLYRAVVRDGDDLALEILGKAIVPLTYIGADRWKMRPNPSVVLAFDRSEDGKVSGYHVGEHVEYRFEPSAELPSADELAERVAQTHRVHLLESLGPLRTRGSIEIAKLGVKGAFTSLVAWPDRFRFDGKAGDQVEHIAFDGVTVWYSSTATPRAALEGARAELVRHDSSIARFGDWRRGHASVQVIQQLEDKGRRILLVRLGDTSSPASTLFIDAASGRVVHEDGMAFVEGLGRIGQRLDFGDFRDVSGMLLPFRSSVEFASSILGAIISTTTEFELGVELPEGVFELRD